MIDPLAAALANIGDRNYVALPLAACAGVATSVGPCIAPRYIALTTIVGERRSFVPIVAFVTGLLLAYAMLGLGAGTLAFLIGRTAQVYTLLATALLGLGLFTILRPAATACDEEQTHHRHAGTSGAFVLGASSGLVLSPCCAPALAAFGALSVLAGDPILTFGSLTAFALGHAAPIALFGVFGSAVARAVEAQPFAGAAAVVSGALMIALGAYYGLLA